MSALRVVTDSDVEAAREKRPSRSPEMLFCKISGLLATVSHPSTSVLLIAMAAYGAFRRFGALRKLFPQDASRSKVITELNHVFSFSDRITNDRNGNMLFIDEEEELMFVVSSKEPLLLTVYDRRKTVVSLTPQPGERP